MGPIDFVRGGFLYLGDAEASQTNLQSADGRFQILNHLEFKQ